MSADDEKGRAVPIWLWPNLLSLDAPLVAVIWQGLFAAVAGVTLPFSVVGLLGLAVWVIYVSDRLGDAARLDERFPATPRHRFCREHRKGFLGGVILAGVAGFLGAGFLIPSGMAVRGGFLAAMVGLYFFYLMLVRRSGQLIVPKEVLCGILFGAGVNLAPAFYLSQQGGELDSVPGLLKEGLVGPAEALLALPVAAFALLCAMNCALIAHWERGEDAAQDPSAVTHWKRGNSVSPALAFLILALGGIVLAAMHREDIDAVVFLCVSASAMGHWVLDRHGESLSRDARRVLADAMLLTPVVVLPFL